MIGNYARRKGLLFLPSFGLSPVAASGGGGGALGGVLGGAAG